MLKKILLFSLILILLLIYIKKPIIESFNFEYDKNQKLKLYDECKFEGYGFNKLHEIGECSISIQVIPYVKIYKNLYEKMKQYDGYIKT